MPTTTNTATRTVRTAYGTKAHIVRIQPDGLTEFWGLCKAETPRNMIVDADPNFPVCKRCATAAAKLA